MNTFIQLPVAERSPGECCLCPTQKGHPVKGDCKLCVMWNALLKSKPDSKYFSSPFWSSAGNLHQCVSPGVSPWDWLFCPRAQSYQSTAKPAHHFPFSSPCLCNTAASRKGCWTGWPTQQIKWELCQPTQHPEITARAGCRSLPCLNHVVACRACRLPKVTQENSRWATN